MILRFSVENFRSIADRQEFSMVAGRLKGDERHVIKLPNQNFSVLRSAAILGANSSGKTTILRALSFFSSAVRNSQTSWRPDDRIAVSPFAFWSADRPTRMELDFFLNETRYTYGFSLTQKEIEEEWLLTYSSSRPQSLFTRSAGKNFSYGKQLLGNKKLIESSVRNQSLFLSAAAQNNHELLTPLYKWISAWNYVEANRRADLVHTLKLCCSTQSMKDIALRVLKDADLGIVDMMVEEQEPEESKKAIYKAVTSVLPDLAALPIERTPFHSPLLTLFHKGGDKVIGLSQYDESNGTIALLSLLGPIAMAINNSGVVLIDEIDSSIHPNLTKKLIHSVNVHSNKESTAQVIFNTHDSTILDSDLLRRDQIWFTEKSEDGATILYPLSDFKPRRGEQIEKGYLQGRFGGVPFLDDFEGINEPDLKSRDQSEEDKEIASRKT